jgi:hypothetical protein
LSDASRADEAVKPFDDSDPGKAILAEVSQGSLGWTHAPLRLTPR